MAMPVMNVPKFERFFRIAAGLDVDKNDVKRWTAVLAPIRITGLLV